MTAAPAMVRPGVERLPSGDERGLDPRDLSQADLATLGHEPMSPLRALRLRCLHCCMFVQIEVRGCTSIACPAWPFRMGKNPYRTPMSQEQRDAARDRFARNINSASPNALQDSEEDEPDEVPAITLPDDGSLDFFPTSIASGGKRTTTGETGIGRDGQ